MVDDLDPESKQRIDEISTEVAFYEGAIVTITDQDTDTVYAELFAELRGKRKKIEEWFDGLKEPITEALRKLNAEQKKLVDPIKEYEGKISVGRTNWYNAEVKRAKEESKIAALLAPEGEVAVMAPLPQKTVSTAAGNVGTSKQKSWRSTDDPSVTAKSLSESKTLIVRTDPRFANVPDSAFVMAAPLVTALLKTGGMPEGEHSIEEYIALISTLRTK